MTPHKAPHKLFTSRFGMFFLLILLVFGAASVFYASFSYQQNVKAMINAVESAKNALDSTQVIEVTPARATHGETLITGLICVDTNCPQVEANWNVLIDKGGFKEFEDMIIQKIHSSSAANNWHVSLYDSDVEQNEYPSLSSAGKIWIRAHIFVY